MTAMAMKTSIQTICLSSPKYNYHDDSILFMLYNVGEICYYRIGHFRLLHMRPHHFFFSSFNQQCYCFLELSLLQLSTFLKPPIHPNSQNDVDLDLLFHMNMMQKVTIAAVIFQWSFSDNYVINFNNCYLFHIVLEASNTFITQRPYFKKKNSQLFKAYLFLFQ